MLMVLAFGNGVCRETHHRARSCCRSQYQGFSDELFEVMKGLHGSSLLQLLQDEREGVHGGQGLTSSRGGEGFVGVRKMASPSCRLITA